MAVLAWGLHLWPEKAAFGKDHLAMRGRGKPVSRPYRVHLKRSIAGGLPLGGRS